mgnify:CR=1 FL=1
METAAQLPPVNIAVIDDETMNLELIGFIIGQMGHEPTLIQDSTMALEQLKQQVPNLILLDVQMPKMNGFELCGIIKGNKLLKEIPIIFITGMDRTENKIKGLELGGVDYVTKPFNPMELKARIKTHIDLSLARKKVEDQAQRLLEDLTLKNRIFSIIGHDLRSPLGAAKLKLDFILGGLIDPKSNDFLDDTVYELSSTMDEALNLLQNLLGWGKSESGQLEVIPERLDLHDLTQQTYRLLKLPLTHKNIVFLDQTPEPTHAFADLNTIRTVLRNLVSNAIKFTPSGGTISINAKRRGEKVIMEVVDTGQGIAKEDLKKILNPNEHFSKLGTEQEPGTGLGLILCQSFVKKNGGTLKIKSEVGQGSTFYFDLPMAPPNGALD